MDWFATDPVLRAFMIGAGTFLVVLTTLWGMLRNAEGLGRSGLLALASVPAGLMCGGVLALAGLVGLLHPWSPLAAAASGLAPLGLMVLVGIVAPAIRERTGGPADPELPPPPLPDAPGRLPPPEETP